MTKSGRVVEINPLSDPRWDVYVRAHPHATANHLGAWAVILEAAYRFERAYLAFEEGSGEIAGVMPLVYGTGLLSGRRMISLPALRWAGPLAATKEREADLLDAACELVRSRKAGRLGMVTMTGGYDALVDHLGPNPAPPSWRLALPADPDEYRRKLRKRSKGCFHDVKRAKASGVVVRDTRSKADLRTFYRLYLRTMRRHRALPRPFKEMSLARELLGPGIVRLSLAELDGKPIAGLVCHFFNGMVETMYNASDERYLRVHPNHALYDHAIATAIGEGLTRFDFGGAWPHETLASFKRHWGSEPVDRFGYVYPAERGSGAGARALLSAHASARESSGLAARAWSRVPLAVTRLAGEAGWRYL